MKRERHYYVYIMANMHRTLYVGMTNGLERRVLEHRSKQIPSFVTRYDLTKLVYYEEFQYVLDAIAREKQIKGWRRAKKVALVEDINPDWKDLAAGWFDGQMVDDWAATQRTRRD
jgi:putative endonuclease